MTAPARLAEIAARLRNATPGPWEWDGPFAGGWGHEGPDLMAGEQCIITSWGHDADGLNIEQPDATLIANAPTDLAYLLTIADCASALLTALRAHGESDAAYAIRRWVQGDAADLHSDEVAVFEALTALQTALEGETS